MVHSIMDVERGLLLILYECIIFVHNNINFLPFESISTHKFITLTTIGKKLVVLLNSTSNNKSHFAIFSYQLLKLPSKNKANFGLGRNFPWYIYFQKLKS